MYQKSLLFLTSSHGLKEDEPTWSLAAKAKGQGCDLQQPSPLSD